MSSILGLSYDPRRSLPPRDSEEFDRIMKHARSLWEASASAEFAVTGAIVALAESRATAKPNDVIEKAEVLLRLAKNAVALKAAAEEFVNNPKLPPTPEPPHA